MTTDYARIVRARNAESFGKPRSDGGYGLCDMPNCDGPADHHERDDEWYCDKHTTNEYGE